MRSLTKRFGRRKNPVFLQHGFHICFIHCNNWLGLTIRIRDETRKTRSFPPGQINFRALSLPHRRTPPNFLSVLDTAQFDYELPESAIAQVPADRREESRLLVIDRKTGGVSDHLFRELPALLPDPYRIYRNTVSVIKARLRAQRPTGGQVECLLLHPATGDFGGNRWHCLLKPGKKLPPGSQFGRAGLFEATVQEKHEDGTVVCDFDSPLYDSVVELSHACGEVPLPPYIHRSPGDEFRELDEERYQTTYANPAQPYAVAAPTAGLHFTPEIFQRLASSGHTFHDLVLHVGLGTFRPIDTDSVEDFSIHRECYEIPASTRASLLDTTLRLAVGTTSLRAIEDYYRKTAQSSTPPLQQDYVAEADIFIYPPDQFFTNALITNFHLPKSTLLCLVSAFLTPGSTEGIQWLQKLYKAALARNYRFYSYGDAMLIL